MKKIKKKSPCRRPSCESPIKIGEYRNKSESDIVENLCSSNPEFEKLSFDMDVPNIHFHIETKQKKIHSDIIDSPKSHKKQSLRQRPCHTTNKKSKRLSSKGKTKQTTKAHSFLQAGAAKNEKRTKSNEGIFGYPRLSEDYQEKLQLITPVPGFLDFQLPVINTRKPIESINEINMRYSFGTLFVRLSKAM